MQEENYKETNILLGILLTILIAINSLAILFIIGIAKVDALGYVYDNNMTSMLGIGIGTRSQSTITNKSVLETQVNSSNNPDSYIYGWTSQIDSQYVAIKLIPTSMQFVQNNIYTITVYYRIATSFTSASGSYGPQYNYNNNYLSTYSGICIGGDTTCYQTQNNNTTTIINRMINSKTTYINYSGNSYTSGNGNIYETEVYTTTFVIESPSNGSQVVLYLNSNTTNNNKYIVIFGTEIENYGMDVNSAINGVATTTDITNSTNSINNNITSMRDSINQQTQQSTQDQINSQKVCTNYEYGNEDLNTSGYLNPSGIIAYANNWYYSSDYLKIAKNIEITINKNYTGGTGANICLYDINKTLISCNAYNNDATEWTINTGNASYIRFSGSKANQNSTTVAGTYCQNGNQALATGPGWNYTNPDSSSIDEEMSLSDQLDAFIISENDLDNLDIEMDLTTSGQIWSIFSNIITGNTLLYGTFLTILFLGVVKTMFAR